MDSVNFVSFYKSYHTYWLNKVIHAICIPLIVFTVVNYINILCRKYEREKILYVIILLFLGNYFYSYSLLAGLVMSFYMYYITVLSNFFCDIFALYREHILLNSIIFVFAWVCQFIGHAIEGNRPALVDSLSQAVFQAPLFSVEYVLPFNIL